jgi:hypothetical protein
MSKSIQSTILRVNSNVNHALLLIITCLCLWVCKDCNQYITDVNNAEVGKRGVWKVVYGPLYFVCNYAGNLKLL